MAKSFRDLFAALCRILEYIVLPAGVVLALSGCVNAIEMSHSTVAQLSLGVANGRPPGLHSGDHFAYWLWRDGDGTWLCAPRLRENRIDSAVGYIR